MTAARRVFGVGLVGAGGFAAFLAAAIADLPEVRLDAVADPDVKRAGLLAARHDAAVAGDSAALLARDSVDIVAIATPPRHHADLAVEALAAGRHVFCEKPLAVTLVGADRVRDAVGTSGRVLVVDHVLRYNPLLRAIGELRETGLLGPVQRFAFENDAADEDLPEGHWFWDVTHSGGILIEHGVHFFDAASMLIGSEPESVQALGFRRESGTVDSVVATTSHPGGASASYAHSFAHARRAERQLMRIDFGAAEARVHGWIPLHAELDIWTDDLGASQLKALGARGGRVFEVAGYRCTGSERLTVTVERGAGSTHAISRGRQHCMPHHARVHLALGAQVDKPRVYAASVRAAMADLVHCAVTGGRPVANVDVGWHAVRTAAAATAALRDGCTHDVLAGGGGRTSLTERSRSSI